MVFPWSRYGAAIGLHCLVAYIAGIEGLSIATAFLPLGPGYNACRPVSFDRCSLPRATPISARVGDFSGGGNAARRSCSRGERFENCRPLDASMGPASTIGTVMSGNSTFPPSVERTQESSPAEGIDLSGQAVGQSAAARGTEDAGELTRGTPRKPQNFVKTLWQFSRPHTMIGTALAIPSLGAFACPPGMLPGMKYVAATLWALVPSLLINIYITGLNQIIDVDIDKVNKPELPIAAGRLSTAGATGTVLVCLLIGCWLGLMPAAYGSLGLALTVLLSVLIGTSYSLPPIRLKRFPQFAATCVFVVRGSIINAGFYAHAQAAAYGLGSGKSALGAFIASCRQTKCALAMAYFTVFAVVIALMKDIPDVKGDRMFNIPSFSVVYGEGRLFTFARRVLTALLWSASAVMFVGAKMAVQASLPTAAARRAFVALSALGAGQLVRRQAIGVDASKPAHVYSYYMFAWKIFYASYLVLPFAR